MFSEAIRFEAGHFGVQVTIVQPGTIRTEMTDREQKFDLPAYAPLVKQYAERFACYRQRRAPPPSRSPARLPTCSTVAAWRCASGRAALGTAVRRLSLSLLGRLVRSPYKW
jgi:NAD(P)-dependent dehydrogenase (short-subunit alcohol dehydrogenase family)